MSTKTSIAGLDKAAVLAALYNAAKPLGMGFLRAQPGDMTVEQAREELQLGDDHVKDFNMRSPNELYFDYLHGRPLKVNLSGDEVDFRKYNRDQGPGYGEAVIAELRARA